MKKRKPSKKINTRQLRPRLIFSLIVLVALALCFLSTQTVILPIAFVLSLINVYLPIRQPYSRALQIFKRLLAILFAIIIAILSIFFLIAASSGPFGGWILIAPLQTLFLLLPIIIIITIIYTVYLIFHLIDRMHGRPVRGRLAKVRRPTKASKDNGHYNDNL